MTVEKEFDFIFPAGDQIDLETWLADVMIERATADIKYAVANQWGESRIKLGDEVHHVQWQYVGLEAEDYEEKYNEETQQLDYVPVGDWFWEYDGPDFEVSCSWLES